MTNDNHNIETAKISGENELVVFDEAGNEIAFDHVLIQLSKKSSDDPVNIKSLATIELLRNYEPDASGDTAIVREYYEGTGIGGGVFIYDAGDKSSKDDNGFVFVTPKGARWRRSLSDYNDVNVLFFGANNAGLDDCSDAVKSMWEWSQENCPSIGIRFPAGRFMISSFDISDKECKYFRLAGHQVNSGYYAATTLISDKKNEEFMFKVKSRYTEISNLTIDGENSTEAVNTKGFYKNIIEAGQFVRVANMNFVNLGGHGLDMIDTLDCKINQWYASNCSATVIYATWSGNPAGEWDHITAIELSNFNVQKCTKSPAIDLQRATQSLIWNGWIEHTEYPGNISNGQWTINSLSIEDCKNPLECHYGRIINNQLNLQSGSSIDFSESGDRWDSISLYEMGDVQIENHGLKVHGTICYDYVSTEFKMDNRTDKEKWFYIGELAHSLNTTQTKIRIIGSAAFNTMSDTQIDYSGRTPEGGADIYVQKINDNTYIGSWCGKGSVPIVRVLLMPGDSVQKVRIYIKVAQYTGFCSALVETNDYNRFGKGVHYMFSKSFTLVDETECAELEKINDNCFHQHWMGNSKVGFGFNNDGELLFKGISLPVADFSEPAKCLKVYIDGKPYGIELRPFKQ